MNEKTTFKGSPSQLINFGFYILCFLLLFIYGLGLLLFLIRFLKTRYTKFEITDERIIEQIGVFSRTKSDEYRKSRGYKPKPKDKTESTSNDIIDAAEALQFIQ